MTENADSNDIPSEEDFNAWYKDNFTSRKRTVIIVPNGAEKRTLYEKVDGSFFPVVETRRDDYIHEVLGGLGYSGETEILEDGSTKIIAYLTITPDTYLSVARACGVLDATWYSSETHYRRNEAIFSE